MSSASLRPTVLAGLVVVVLNTAYCGGRIGEPLTVGPDASTSGLCPYSQEIYAVGAQCAWTGTCPVQVDVCGNGQGVPIDAICSGGGIAISPFDIYSCSGSGGGPGCPNAVIGGESCENDGMSCRGQGATCGKVTCTCEDGQWVCPSCVGIGSGPGDDAGEVDAGEGDDSGSAPDSGSTPDSGPTCVNPPTQLYPEMASGVFCPFSSVGAPNLTCAAGRQCCETPEAAGTPSTCNPLGPCPVAGSIKLECDGTPDCAASNEICCGFGSIAMEPPQPGCGPGGSTTPEFPYASGFAYGVSGIKGSGGTFCASTCALVVDGGPLPTFQVCSQTSECPSGQSCIPINPEGAGIGYCGGAPDAGTGG